MDSMYKSNRKNSKENSNQGGLGPEDLASLKSTDQSGKKPDGHVPRIHLKFNNPKKYPSNVHQDMLALSKQDYHGKDFFQRNEFRGLLLADYQEAIGEKAFQCVDQLNTNTVSQFSDLKSFKEALSKRKLLDKFYK